MRLKDFLFESQTKTREGSIDSVKLETLIRRVMKKYEIDPGKYEEIKRVVITDYEDSDISKITSRDVVEILDASGY